MKRKFSSLLMLFIACLILTGCGTTYSIFGPRKKPNAFYYTNLLAKNLTLEKKCNCKVIDMNFYKEKELTEENVETMQKFLKSLNKDSFIQKPDNLPDNPSYKMFLSFSGEKYVINVYDDENISIFPWDGNYDMDYVSMKDTPVSLNLFRLCKFLY